MSEDDIDDYWTQALTAPEKQSEPLLHIETIGDVEPLDDQFGIDHPKTVPDALYESLLGRPEPTATELAQAGGDPAKVLPLHTYAILDAAKVANLAEMLETSGLEHRCLFKGDAFEGMKDAAPWIVRLEDGNRFTRNLFTRSDAPWHLWDVEAGIYLQSSYDLATLWAHFRKFVKLKDRNERWQYFRFWEPLVLQAYLSVANQRSQGLCPLMYGAEGLIVESYICCPVPGDVSVHKAIPHKELAAQALSPKLTRLDERAIAAAMQRRRQLEISLALRKSFADETVGANDRALYDLVGHVIQKMGQYQVRSIRHIHTFAAWQLIYGAGFEGRDPDGYAQKVLDAPIQEEQKMAHLKNRLDDLHKAGWL